MDTHLVRTVINIHSRAFDLVATHLVHILISTHHMHYCVFDWHAWFNIYLISADLARRQQHAVTRYTLVRLITRRRALARILLTGDRKHFVGMHLTPTRS